LNCQKSAEAILDWWIYLPVEGLNFKRFWKFEGLKRNTIKADNFSGRLFPKEKAGSLKMMGKRLVFFRRQITEETVKIHILLFCRMMHK